MERLDKPEVEKTLPKGNPKVVPKKPVVEESGVPGLDPQVVKSALQSGIDRSQLEQLGQLMGRFGGKTLGDTPAAKKKVDPLGEVIETVAIPGDPEEAEVIPTDPMTHALVKLTVQHRRCFSFQQAEEASFIGRAVGRLYVCRGVQFVELSANEQPSSLCSVEGLEKGFDGEPNRSVLLHRVPNASRFWCTRGRSRTARFWRNFSRLGGTSKSCASYPWDSSHSVGHLWGIGCSQEGQSRRRQSSSGFVGGFYRPSGGRQRELDSCSRGATGREPTDCVVLSPPASRDDRVATYEAVGRDLGRVLHAQDQRDRRLCREASEARKERPKTPCVRCSRSKGERKESERSRSRKRSVEPASRRGESCKLDEQSVSPPGGVEMPGVFRDDSACKVEPSASEFKPSVPKALPGSRASSVHPRGWWLASFRLASQLGGSFSCFIRSFHRRLATPPESVGTASLWPMPLPFVSEMRGGVSDELPDSVPLRRGVNMVVLVLNWLYLRRPKTCPAEICLGARLNKLQWRVVRNLERLLEAWNSSDVIDASSMGRSASKIENMEEVVWKLAQFEKSASDWLEEIAPSSSDTFKGSNHQFVHAPGLQRVSAGDEVGELPCSEIVAARPIVADRLEFRGEPRFDPGPFLDSRGKSIYFDPIVSATSPAASLIDPPLVRIHATEEEKWKLFRKLDSGKRLGIVPYEDALPGYQAGLFSVLKSSEQDRLIFDSRPFNCLEEECGPWSASMASASNLLDIQLSPGEVLRTSCTDLRDFYYGFKVNYQRLRRNTLVGPIPFKKLTTLQCAKGMKLDDDHICFLSLRSLAMGDSHAVELAQTSHLGILIQSGLLTAERFVSMNLAIPRSPQMVGVIIDDLVLFERMLRQDFVGPAVESWGSKSMREALARYEELGLIPHLGKTYVDQSVAEVWGCQVDGTKGIVRASLRRVIPIVYIITGILKIGVCTISLLEVIVGCLTSVFLFRRRLLSLLNVCYEAMHRGGNRRAVIQLSEALKTELFLCISLLPLACTDLRATNVDTLFACDASDWGIGVTGTVIPRWLSSEIHRHRLHRSVWAKLLSPFKSSQRVKGLLPPEDELPEGYMLPSHPLWMHLYLVVCSFRNFIENLLVMGSTSTLLKPAA